MSSTFRPGLLAVLALTGCAATGPGYVVRDWSSNLRELGIYPLFPPQENICAGDVFVTPAADKNDEEVVDPKGFVPIGNRFDHVPYGAALDEYYAGRARFPATSASAAETETSGVGGCGAKVDTALLRQVAFPLFVRAQVTAAQLGAYLPADAYVGRLATGASAARGASVSVTSGEAYGLPLTVGLQLFTKHYQIRDGVLPSEVLDTLRLARQGQPGASKTHVTLTLVNEVYFARAFDVSLHRSSQAGLDLAAEAATGTLKPVAAASAPLPGTPAVGASAASGAQGAVQTAKSSSSGHWSTLSTPSSPGVSVQVISASNGDVALRAAYSRPIAIGYRGLHWRVSLVDGRLSPASPSSGNFQGTDLPLDALVPTTPATSGTRR